MLTKDSYIISKTLKFMNIMRSGVEGDASCSEETVESNTIIQCHHSRELLACNNKAVIGNIQLVTDYKELTFQ